VATGQALRIDTLHGPSRQILHVSPPLCSGGLQVEPEPDSDGLQQSQNLILAGSTLQEAFSVKVEPEPASNDARPSLRSGSLDQKRNGKVAGILRPWTCGVKRKDTISSGRVAEGTAQSELVCDLRCLLTARNVIELLCAKNGQQVNFICERNEKLPTQKRVAATKASRTMATWFCSGLSVPCSSGRRGHVSIQTDPITEKWLALYNTEGFAHNLSCPVGQHEEFCAGKGSECGLEVRARCLWQSY